MRKIVLFDPKLRSLVFRLLRNQKSFTKIREANRRLGIEVPPILIFSVTDKCNLSCKGCYHRAHRKNPDRDLATGEIVQIIKEAQELGTSVILLAGGEPFSRSDVLEIISKFPKITFFVFTNSLLINDLVIQKLKKIPNVILVISLEGNKNETNERRGPNVYDQIMQKIEMLNQSNILYGISATITNNNIKTTISNEFVENLIALKCKVFFYSEYMPINDDSNTLILSKKQSQLLFEKIKNFRDNYPAVFFTTRDEDEFGGCLAAGKGFVHVNSQGHLEPCPMAPFSESDLKKTSLRDALQSEFFSKLKKEPLSLLKDTKSGCSLWDKRDWVKSLLE